MYWRVRGESRLVWGLEIVFEGNDIELRLNNIKQAFMDLMFWVERIGSVILGWNEFGIFKEQK